MGPLVTKNCQCGPVKTLVALKAYILRLVSAGHVDTEFLIDPLFQVIGECYSTQINDQVATKYKDLGGSQDREIFLDFGLQILLYQPTSQRLMDWHFILINSIN